MVDKIRGRELALIALINFEKKKKIPSKLGGFKIIEKGNKPNREIQKAYDYFFGTVKMIRRIDYILEKHLKNKRLEELPLPIRNILREGVYGLLFSGDPEYAVVNEMVNLAKKFGHNGTVALVNAVLRNIHPVEYPKERIEYLSIYYSFPEFLVRMLLKDYGDEITEKILKESNKPPITTIRVNRIKVTPEEVVQELKKKGFKVQEIENRKYNLISESKVIYSESFKKGHFQIQGVTQNINIELLSPQRGEIILDLCAAPGTKSTGIAELMEDEGIVLAVDKKNLHLISQNAKRLGIKSVYPVKADVLNFSVKEVDRILLDVPCSGTGIMNKKGDIRWNLTEESLERLIKLQREMLWKASENLKPGGILVYSTCSVLKRENEEQIEWFLREKSGFTIDYAKNNDIFIKNLPEEPFYDGGFGAIIRRR
ncbi:MAG: 16S rRNA (cytosine(967)-C(5))-methyltransferase RsmB [candidate division WOR-3 bacterium]